MLCLYVTTPLFLEFKSSSHNEPTAKGIRNLTQWPSGELWITSSESKLHLGHAQDLWSATKTQRVGTEEYHGLF